MARRTQAERSEATSAHLLSAARRLFGRTGYDSSSIAEIAAEAGATKGAAYHHFSGKVDLFRAVFVCEQERVVAVLEQAAAEESDAWSALLRGCRTFLEHCLDREFRRIVLVDGPAVLGWAEVREIEYEHVLRTLTEGMRLAAAEGRVREENLEVRCQMAFGALCEAGMLLARSPDPAALLPAVTAEAERFLATARSPGPSAPQR